MACCGGGVSSSGRGVLINFVNLTTDPCYNKARRQSLRAVYGQYDARIGCSPPVKLPSKYPSSCCPLCPPPPRFCPVPHSSWSVPDPCGPIFKPRCPPQCQCISMPMFPCPPAICCPTGGGPCCA